jgi:hypothetical protein
MKRRFFLLLSVLWLMVSAAHAEERYMRYRVLSPATPTVATISVQSHILSETSWQPMEKPGVISNYGLYLAPNTWSPWRRLPDSPTWGTIQLNLKSIEPIQAAKAEFQLASYASENDVVRQFTESSETGGSVAFLIPPEGILENPRGVETLSESYARRRKVAEDVAIPMNRRPQLLRFSGWGVGGHRTVKDSEAYEIETTKLLGFNTFGQRNAGKYIGVGTTSGSEAYVDKLDFTPEEARRLAFVMIEDEPSWQSGFNDMWKRTNGNEGFRQYLKDNKVSPALFGKKTLGEVSHINRNNEVAADAPLEQRRLWYWSCRYTYDLDAEYYAGVTKKLEAKYPGAQSAVNYSDHQILLGEGIALNNPDIYAWGRKRAVSMQWSEDWFFPGLTSWGNGMYQKLAYLTDMMRCAGRATTPAQTLGYHVVSNVYDPFNPTVDETVSARINLLLGRGVKTFSFFNYGPTSSGTVDWWADGAPTARGTADALRLVGGEPVERFLWEGQPGKTEACMFYSVPASFWQRQNKTGSDNQEKQLLYCMLAQEHIPTDVIDTTDLDRWIKEYKVAYLVDSNIPSAQAAKLLEWVKAGGVLALWPEAASKDEFNEPLKVFPTSAGKTVLGKGQIVRFPEHMATKWWERIVELNKDKSTTPVLTDPELRSAVAAPALQLAKVHRPVVAGANGIDVRALYSARGVAVPVVNLQYLLPSTHHKVHQNGGATNIIYTTESEFEDGCVRYTKEKPATVTLNDAADIVQVYSSRLGNLPFTREGESITVKFPLNTTDILIFSRSKLGASTPGA